MSTADRAPAEGPDDHVPTEEQIPEQGVRERHDARDFDAPPPAGA